MGRLNAELFEEWFEKVFLYYAPPARPLLLLLDGHSAHYHPAVVRKAAATGVIIFCFQPHTTHFIQPLDKTVFGPLKVYWREQCRRFMAKDPGRVIKRVDFGEIFSAAWYEAMTPKKITAGFRTTGIYPLNRRAIRLPGYSQPSQSVPSSASKHIAYLPMYTPGWMERLCSQGGDNSDSLDNESEHSSPTDPHTCIFSESYMDEVQLSKEEINKFERQFEEGYDLRNDPRYNLWLERRERLATDFPSDVSTGETGLLSHSNPSVPEVVNAHTKRYPSRVRSKVTEKGQQQQLRVKKPSDKLALGIEKRTKPVCTSTESSPDESSDFHFTDRVKKSLSKSQKTSAGEIASFSHPNPFTEEEINKFERRFEEGYDLRNDPRYNLWLERRERLATDFPSDVSTGATGFLCHINPSVPKGVNARTKRYPSRGRSKFAEKNQQQQQQQPMVKSSKKPSDELALGTEKRKKPVCTSAESSLDKSLDFQFTEEVKKVLEQIPKDICWRNSIVVPSCLRRCDCSCKAVPF